MKYYLFIALLFSGFIKAQDYSLDILIEDFPGIETIKDLNSFNGEKSDSLEIIKAIFKIKTYLYENGYLLSEASLSWSNKKALLNIKTGNTFSWLEPEISLPENFPLVLIQQNNLFKGLAHFFKHEILIRGFA